MTGPWLFAQWGIDLVDPMPPSKGGMKFIIVAVDYFTKWAEADAMVIVTAQNVTKFIWKAIVCRWCVELGIKVKYSSPGHPHVNEQVEATNKTIVGILKKKVGEKKGAWAYELSKILWAYRTTSKTSSGETPFALAYGIEAMILVEVGVPSHRSLHFNDCENERKLEEHLDLLKKKGKCLNKGSYLQEEDKVVFQQKSKTKILQSRRFGLKRHSSNHDGRRKARTEMGRTILGHRDQPSGDLSPKRYGGT
ncbi:hypothetical protein F2P56_032828 [Juglans regia]|uniref:Integrase catalytic domain-containing protein n=2 Tax=Juglans regia TaxID=51240 RepID=A0A833TGF3_JUGRE|nr:uncharacterized protein LOC109020696 [Juglans regia]KAF5447261.1 hypothetical protein F2P56_032828 [Juglans regia]